MRRFNLGLCLLLASCQPKKASTTTPVTTAADANVESGSSGTQTSTSTSETKTTSSNTSSGSNPRVVCSAPAGTSNDPRSIAEAISLINALPKPVTVSCLIDSLKGPFRIQATSSVFSAQPAFSKEAPRIFLFFEPLYLSVVPRGSGSEVVEFSEAIAGGLTVKGEVAFPVTETLASDAPYTRIKYEQTAATSCGGCHKSEVAAPAPFPATAFASGKLKPTDAYDVSPADLVTSAQRCATLVLDECPVLEALTGKGDLIQAKFE